MRRYGASKEEWAHFAYVLGAGVDLLPVVSKTDAVISSRSTLGALGKVPSCYNHGREVIGFPGWTRHHTTREEIDCWSQEPDYGICLQNRTLRALDLDLDSPKALEIIRSSIGVLPIRERANSAHVLLLFQYEGALNKRVMKTAAGNIELLATGQQCVVAGTHPTGVPYQWPAGLPDPVPTVSMQALETCWKALESALQGKSITRHTPKALEDEIAQHLINKDWVLRIQPDQSLAIRCPFEEFHTTESGITATVYYPAHTGGYMNGHFVCLHAHCEDRKDEEFLTEIGYSFFFEEAETEIPERARFQAISAKDYASTTDTDRWLIKGILPHAELGLLYGEPCAGKSFLALDMALAIGSGAPWREQFKTTRQTVVYIAAEGGRGIRKRLAAYVEYHESTLDTHDVYIIPDTPHLMDRADIAGLAKSLIHQIGSIGLIIVDTLAQSLVGGDENKGSDMTTALDNCRALGRATDSMVLLIHHAGKDVSKGARGWSGLKGAADVEFEVVLNESAEGPQKLRTFRVSKGKDFDATESSCGFSLVSVPLGADSDGDPISSCVIYWREGKPTPMKKLKDEKLALFLEE